MHQFSWHWFPPKIKNRAMRWIVHKKSAHTWVLRGGKKEVTILLRYHERCPKRKQRWESSRVSHKYSRALIYTQGTPKKQNQTAMAGTFDVEIGKSVEQSNALLCFLIPLHFPIHNSHPSTATGSHQTSRISHSRHPKKRATAPAPPPSASSSA